MLYFSGLKWKRGRPGVTSVTAAVFPPTLGDRGVEGPSSSPSAGVSLRAGAGDPPHSLRGYPRRNPVGARDSAAGGSAVAGAAVPLSTPCGPVSARVAHPPASPAAAPNSLDLGRVRRPLPPPFALSAGGGSSLSHLRLVAVVRPAAAPAFVPPVAHPGGCAGDALPPGGGGQGCALPPRPRGQGQDGSLVCVGGERRRWCARPLWAFSRRLCGGGCWGCSRVGVGCSPFCCCCPPWKRDLEFCGSWWASEWGWTWGCGGGPRWGGCRCCRSAAGFPLCWTSPLRSCRTHPDAPPPADAGGAGGVRRCRPHAGASARGGGAHPRDYLLLGSDA